MTDTSPIPDDVQQLLDEVYPDPADQQTWLATPNALLAGDTPSERLAVPPDVDPVAPTTVSDVLRATSGGAYDAGSQLDPPPSGSSAA